MTNLQKSKFFIFLALATMLLMTAGCSDDNDPADPPAPEPELQTPDWTEATHGKVDPNFEVVFNQDTVQRLDIVISAALWQTMLEDMTATFGDFGAGGLLPPPGSITENPIWVEGSVFHNDSQWYKVGIRFKGFSSLGGAWAMGVGKLPLKLDFDEWEETYPRIENQRFHGFKKLTLANAIEDKSLMRDKVAADMFRAAGLVAPHTAFYRVFLDYGEGPEYFGLYTMIESVDNTVLKTQYNDNDGNLYKPEGPGASFEEGTFSEQWFEKKTNEDNSNWADIQNVFSAVHSSLRQTDPAAWRTNLEQVFNVSRFINWLAINTVIQNWDTYGKMPHNYYLYNDPDTGRLDYIPWDNNEAFSEGKKGGALSLAMDEVGDDWPLIRFLLDDPAYLEAYKNSVQQVTEGFFNSGEIVAVYQANANLIGPFVVGPDGEQPGYTFLTNQEDFSIAITELITHAGERTSAVDEYLAD